MFVAPRSKEQIVLDNVRLVIPYDEFLILHHTMVEWEQRGPTSTIDM